MKFSEFRKLQEASGKKEAEGTVVTTQDSTSVPPAPVFKKALGEPADVGAINAAPDKSATATGEAETTHQNKDLLNMKDQSKGKSVWIPRTPKLAKVDEAAKVHHKVKIRYGNGKSEERLIDDDELGALKRTAHVTKVTHLGRSGANGKLLEYALDEMSNGAETVFQHADGSKAVVTSHKYADPSLGTDHYVHIPNSRATVYGGDEGLDKAHKLLKKLGYSLAPKE
jgi:hypothetical protein